MKIRLLIVDDEAPIRKGFSEYIPWDLYNCEVAATACNGEEAIQIIDSTEQKINIVITDVKMPVLDGIGLAKYIYEHHPEITVIILSGYSEFEYARSAMKYHVSQYLLKPAAKDELIEAVQEITKKLYPSFNRYSPLINEAISYIQEHLAEDLSLELIAQNVHTNASYLSRTFKKECSVSIINYITDLRMKKAKELLKTTNLKTFEISEAIGISDPAYFSVLFKKYTGLNPTAYRDSMIH